MNKYPTKATLIKVKIKQNKKKRENYKSDHNLEDM